MDRIISVRFRTTGKLYFFDPGEYDVKKGDHVIVETSRGIEYGTIVDGPRDKDPGFEKPIREILRPANDEDEERHRYNREKEKDAFRLCKEKIVERGLDMKLIDAEYTFDNSKILFYFTADGRVDFRELVRELAGTFKTRIELRQIGVRDETKMIGGYGSCGRVLCCHAYLSDFAPVSIRMAKEQNLSLNPTKISGMCGRLMCCLKNEEDVYEELNRRMPGAGDIMEVVEDGTQGEVVSVNILRQTVKITVTVGDEKEAREYKVDDLKLIQKKSRKKGAARQEQQT